MVWSVKKFVIRASEKYKNFKRGFHSSNDCVINALQLIGIIDQRDADIIRIILGEEGAIRIDQIEGIFDYIEPNKKHKFVNFHHEETIERQLEGMKWNNFPTVVFAGVKYKAGSGHVFLIEYSPEDGSFTVIDPQKPRAQAVRTYGKTAKEFIENYLTNIEIFYLLCEPMRRQSQ